VLEAAPGQQQVLEAAPGQQRQGEAAAVKLNDYLLHSELYGINASTSKALHPLFADINAIPAPCIKDKLAVLIECLQESSPETDVLEFCSSFKPGFWNCNQAKRFHTMFKLCHGQVGKPKNNARSSAKFSYSLLTYQQ
jgi:hypothetical protein